MRKAKSVTKHFLRGQRPKGTSEVPIAIENIQRANHAPEVTLLPVTAPQSVAEPVLSHDNPSSQNKPCAIVKSDEHIVETVIQPVSRPVTSSPLSPNSAVIPSVSVDETAEATSRRDKQHMSVPTRISRLLTELDGAMTEFRKNYELFAKKHSDVLLLDDEFNNAFHKAEATDDIKRSAQIFGDGIWAVLQTMETKKNARKSTWLGKLGNFVTKVYPVAMLSLNLAAAVGEVTSFMPLKGAAGGLGIILQLIGDESGRGDEFLSYLQRIEFQAALLAENPKYDLNDVGSSRNLIQEKATSLMAAIIIFFNSALLYFANSFFSKIGKTVVNGPRTFEDGKTRLDTAIREYDQAVFHLAARAVTDLKDQLQMGQKLKQDEELLRWLSGPFESPWLVEGQLVLFRRQRAEATLEWARDMPEFQTWRSSAEQNRPLWIRGTLGLGKSIMAAYFIDLLKCHYPNAIVSYFFCRSNQAGLTTARDIIRTLAYQCIENDEVSHSILHELKRKGFGISEIQEVDFLLEKLLLDPLRGTRKEIYVILDGVDEADLITSNKLDRSGTPEMHVLLRSLTKLPSVRLLFISRPTADICSIVRNTIVKEIGKTETAQDIKKYVQDFVVKSIPLQTLFRNANKNPVRYFEEKADGIFLWVVLVMKQLERAKTQSVFRKYLEGFSAASGSMETLYESILSRIDKDHQKWVKEIIRWLVVAERQLSVEDLKSVVEFCVNDQFADFQEFLKVDCGSILQLIPETDGPDGVQLIHETFRSFILKPEICPPAFLVVQAETHGHVALSSLERLSSSDGSNPINQYWTEFWVAHLFKATSRNQFQILLVHLHKFFTSEGIKTWIKMIEPYDPHYRVIGLQVRVEEEALRQIRDWLGKCQLEEQLPLQRNELVEAAITWRHTILSNVYTLGESVGKAAARVWLYDELDQSEPLITCLRLALKYYWKRPNRTQNNRNELDRLIDTEFEAISTWAGPQGDIVKLNLAIAFFTVFRWDECIRCFDAAKTTKFTEVLATAYIANRDFAKAIELLHMVIAAHPKDAHLLCYLSNAYLGNGEYDLAIKALGTAVAEREPDNSSFYISATFGLWEACTRVGDYDTAIRIFTLATNKNPRSWSLWYLLGQAHLAKDDTNGLCEMFKMAVEKYPKEGFVLTCLPGALNLDSYKLGQIHDICMDKYPDRFVQLVVFHLSNKDFDGALNVLEYTLDRNIGIPTFHWSASLLLVCREKGEYDSGIKMVETALQAHSTNNELLSFLGDAYMAKKDYKRAIRTLERAIKADSFDQRIAVSLFEAYKLNYNYNAAIKLAESHVDEKNTVRSRPWQSKLVEVYQQTGDNDAAVSLFESVVEKSGSWNAGGWSLLLKAYAAKVGYKAAIRQIETAINESQIVLSSSLSYDILDFYKTNGDSTGAIVWFNALVGSYPTDGWSWNVLADAYTAGGQYNEAIHVYREASKRISFDYSFHLRLGDLYLVKLDYTRALEAYTEAITAAASPALYCAYINMRPNQSWKRAEIPIDHNLTKFFLWHSICETYKCMGDYTAASAVYEIATTSYRTAIEKQNEPLLLHYSEPYERSGSFDVFEKRALEEPVLWSALGEVYRAKGELADALTAFRNALKTRPHNPWLQGVVHEISLRMQVSERAESD